MKVPDLLCAYILSSNVLCVVDPLVKLSINTFDFPGESIVAACQDHSVNPGEVN